MDANDQSPKGWPPHPVVRAHTHARTQGMIDMLERKSLAAYLADDDESAAELRAAAHHIDMLDRSSRGAFAIIDHLRDLVRAIRGE